MGMPSKLQVRGASAGVRPPPCPSVQRQLAPTPSRVRFSPHPTILPYHTTSAPTTLHPPLSLPGKPFVPRPSLSSKIPPPAATAHSSNLFSTVSPLPVAIHTATRWSPFAHGAWTAPLDRPTPTIPRQSNHILSTLPTALTRPRLARFWLLSTWRKRLLVSQPSLPPVTGVPSPPSSAPVPRPAAAGSPLNDCNCARLCCPLPPPIFAQPTAHVCAHSSSCCAFPKLQASGVTTTSRAPSASALQNGAIPLYGDNVHPSSICGSAFCSPPDLSLTSPSFTEAVPFNFCARSLGRTSPGTACDVVVPQPCFISAPIPPSCSTGDDGVPSKPFSRMLKTVVHFVHPFPSRSLAPMAHSIPSQLPCSGLRFSSIPAQLPTLIFPTLPRTLHPRLQHGALHHLSQCLQHVQPMAPSIPFRETIAALTAMMSKLPVEDSMSGDNRPRRPATAASLSTGLGPRGNVPVPNSVWNSLGLPSHMPALPRSVPLPQRHSESSSGMMATRFAMVTVSQFQSNLAWLFSLYIKATRRRG